MMQARASVPRRRYQMASRVTPQAKLFDAKVGVGLPQHDHGIGGCHLCTPVSCIADSICSGVVWNGLTAFGRHLQARHPEAYAAYKGKTISGRYKWNKPMPTEDEKAQKLAVVATQLRFIEEVNRASNELGDGIRAIPLENISDVTREQVRAWIAAIKRLPSVRQKLCMEAIGRSKDSYVNNAAYKEALHALQLIIEESSVRNKPSLITKSVNFDPRVALEVVKLARATGQSYSFSLHLLCLYGLSAIADGLIREGITPPTEIPHLPQPSAILEADELRARVLARYLRAEDDPEFDAYGFPDDLTPEDLLMDDDVGEEPHDAHVHREIERLSLRKA